MKNAILVTMLAATTMLAGCVTPGSADPQTAAKATYDNICAIEPSAYLIYITYASTKPVKPSTAAKVDAGHALVTALCEERPTDYVSGLRVVAKAYADMLSYRS